MMNKSNFFLGLVLLCVSRMPWMASAQTVTASFTNNFNIVSPSATSTALLAVGSIPNTRILAAYNALAQPIITAYDASVSGNLVLGAATVSKAVVEACPAGAPAGSICLLVSITFSYQYLNTAFPVKPGPILAQRVQDQINAGNLDCQLRKLFPTSLIRIRTGGGCKNTTPTPPVRPPVASPVRPTPVRAPVVTPTMPVRTPVPVPMQAPAPTLATVTNAFRTVNAGTVSTPTFNSPSSVAHTQLKAAYDSYVKKSLEKLSLSAPITYRGIFGMNAQDDSANCGGFSLNARCHYLTVTIQFNFVASQFGSEKPVQAVVNHLQNGINTGALACELKKLFPSSAITITTSLGATCN